MIYAKLGIESVSEQLVYNLIYAIISAIGAVCGAALSDKMKRRQILVAGTLGMIASLSH